MWANLINTLTSLIFPLESKELIELVGILTRHSMVLYEYRVWRAFVISRGNITRMELAICQKKKIEVKLLMTVAVTGIRKIKTYIASIHEFCICDERTELQVSLSFLCFCRHILKVVQELKKNASKKTSSSSIFGALKSTRSPNIRM